MLRQILRVLFKNSIILVLLIGFLFSTERIELYTKSANKIRIDLGKDFKSVKIYQGQSIKPRYRVVFDSAINYEYLLYEDNKFIIKVIKPLNWTTTAEDVKIFRDYIENTYRK
jgi:hypothetical protein